ncbi:MAG: hypothetical protein K8R35_06675, partial [Bacteroidales bacterium]|nr:hypothetical protein [Bacteroidales bacterium]
MHSPIYAFTHSRISAKRKLIICSIACTILVVLMLFNISCTSVRNEDSEIAIKPKIPKPIPATNDLRSMLTGNLLDRSLKCLSDADIRREKAFHQGDWEAYCESVRQHIREAFGDMPFGKNGGPLNTRLVSTFETKHCRVENVIFESYPGWEVNASVFVPYGEGPFPAVVIPVGHSGKQFRNYQIPAQAFAKLGFIAVLFD